VEGKSPLDTQTLILISAAGLGLTMFLFLVILFGREDEDDPGRFAKRLQAYGRKSKPNEEKRPFLKRISSSERRRHQRQRVGQLFFEVLPLSTTSEVDHQNHQDQ